MTELLTHFTKTELEMIYIVVQSRKAHLAQNLSYGQDYDLLDTIMRKIEKVNKTN